MGKPASQCIAFIHTFVSLLSMVSRECVIFIVNKILIFFSYLADVTNRKNRTTMMALLAGLTILVFPLAEALGGQVCSLVIFFSQSALG